MSAVPNQVAIQTSSRVERWKGLPSLQQTQPQVCLRFLSHRIDSAVTTEMVFPSQGRLARTSLTRLWSGQLSRCRMSDVLPKPLIQPTPSRRLSITSGLEIPEANLNFRYSSNFWNTDFRVNTAIALPDNEAPTITEYREYLCEDTEKRE